MTKEQRISIDTGFYVFQAEPGKARWRFSLPGAPAPVLEMVAVLPLTPRINGVGVDKGKVTIVEKDVSTSFRLVEISAALTGKFSGKLVNELFLLDRRVVCDSYYVIDAKRHSLEAWTIGDAGSRLNVDRVHSYFGNPELMENGQFFSPASCEISTASHNWLYAPMSPRLMLEKAGRYIGVGGTRLAQDYGLKLRLENGVLDDFSFDYGGGGFPFAVDAAGTFRGPRLQLLASSGDNADAAHAEFTRTMIDDGILPAKKHPPESAVWRKPWYCSWGDQAAMEEQNPAAALSEALLLRMARTIRDNGLDIGVFIVDEGWQDRRGDWNLNTGRIADMRSLVAELHSMGFKVVLWWAPFLVDDGSAPLGNPAWTYYSNKQRTRIVNYSNPEVRKHMSDKLDLWISNSGGWDIDGIKLDFMAERIFPEMPCHDSEWRGEERLMNNLFLMIDNVFQKYGKSPGILGEAYNPFLSQYCMAFQCEERFDGNLAYIDNRLAMADALIPGAWLVPHFTYHQEIILAFIKKVLAIGGIPQIGKILEPDVDAGLLGEIKVLLSRPDQESLAP